MLASVSISDHFVGSIKKKVGFCLDPYTMAFPTQCSEANEIMQQVDARYLAAELKVVLNKASADVIVFAWQDFESTSSLFILAQLQLMMLPPLTLLSARLVADISSHIGSSPAALRVVDSILSFIPLSDLPPDATLHDRVTYLLTIHTLIDRFQDMHSLLCVCRRLRSVVQRGA